MIRGRMIPTAPAPCPMAKDLGDVVTLNPSQ
jgi:hypothetical protein